MVADSEHYEFHTINFQIAEFWVSVFTGNKALAGTDAHVTMMLCGKKGCSRKLRLSRTEKKKQTLQRGVTDNFTFVVDDIGFLSRIR